MYTVAQLITNAYYEHHDSLVNKLEGLFNHIRPLFHPSICPNASDLLSDFPMHGAFCQHGNNSLGWSARLSLDLQHVL